MTETHSEIRPPSAVLAILDTFRRSPDAVSERAQASLQAFGLLRDETSPTAKTVVATN